MHYLTRLLVSMFIFFACAPLTHAAPKPKAAARLDEQQRIYDQLTPALKEFESLKKDEELQAKRWDDLKWTDEQLKKQITTHKAEAAEFIESSRRHEAEASAHNARCAGGSTDQSFVNACNAAAATGNANKARLEQQGRHLNEMQALINKAINTQTEETQRVFAKHKANIARMDELRAQVLPLLERLKVIRAETDKCVAAIKGATLEAMHDECGRMFDGNK